VLFSHPELPALSLPTPGLPLYDGFPSFGRDLPAIPRAPSLSGLEVTGKTIGSFFFGIKRIRSESGSPWYFLLRASYAVA